MAEALLLTAAAAAALAGLGWLALAMQVHWAQVHEALPHTPATARALRFGGSASLAASLALCLAADHPSMAVLVWLMLLAAAAVAIAMTLSTRPAWLRPLWPALRKT